MIGSFHATGSQKVSGPRGAVAMSKADTAADERGGKTRRANSFGD